MSTGSRLFVAVLHLALRLWFYGKYFYWLAVSALFPKRPCKLIYDDGIPIIDADHPAIQLETLPFVSQSFPFLYADAWYWYLRGKKQQEEYLYRDWLLKFIYHSRLSFHLVETDKGLALNLPFLEPAFREPGVNNIPGERGLLNMSLSVQIISIPLQRPMADAISITLRNHLCEESIEWKILSPFMKYQGYQLSNLLRKDGSSFLATPFEEGRSNSLILRSFYLQTNISGPTFGFPWKYQGKELGDYPEFMAEASPYIRSLSRSYLLYRKYVESWRGVVRTTVMKEIGRHSLHKLYEQMGGKIPSFNWIDFYATWIWSVSYVYTLDQFTLEILRSSGVPMFPHQEGNFTNRSYYTLLSLPEYCKGHTLCEIEPVPALKTSYSELTKGVYDEMSEICHELGYRCPRIAVSICG